MVEETVIIGEVVPDIVAPNIIIPAAKKPINDFCEMVFVEGGSFMMGSEEYDDEKPIHKVTLNSFYIGKYPVTQKQWVEIMGNNPSHFKGNDNHPVEVVSWNDTQEFIKKLNQKTGQNYRLPSEAEWECAARGGQKSKGYKYTGSNDIEEVAWCWENSNLKTHPVGQKKSNELGIYDMSGNIWEWCEDSWHDNYKNAPNNNSAWVDEKYNYRVLRGGSCYCPSQYCRAANRNINAPANRYSNYGFRLVLP
jgi:formylglycine-generating enzyme required for sulfatase activity